jgi:hypothetical protein
VVLKDEWEPAEARRLIREIVSIYPLRGTKYGLERLIKIYAGESVIVTDSSAEFRVGKSSIVGTNTVVGGLAPHYFYVSIRVSDPHKVDIEAKGRAVRAVVDLEKPAHSYYDLMIEGPKFRIGVGPGGPVVSEYRSRLGIDSWI